MTKQDIIVIGGGAAGLMCAIEAGKRGRKVLVLEHSERVGKKILISGGGRCNFTNIQAGPANYLSANPHFCKSALARYTPSDFIALVEKHGIRYHEKKLGQLFCDISSRQIVELLEKECSAAGVAIQVGSRVQTVAKTDSFQVRTGNAEYECNSLVIATGGLSFPKIGATDFGYRIAEQFGIKRTPTRAGLVPLTFGVNEQTAFGELSGISIDAIATFGKQSFRENILFTHRGLSGPAILQISSYSPDKGSIFINCLPDLNAIDLFKTLRNDARELTTILSEHLPRRFVQQWCMKNAPSRPINRLSQRELQSIAERLHRWEVPYSGTEGYAKAEVTLGGIDTSELSSKTMGARQVPGLYFIGEVVDVTGWLGGYNLQWAWASGYAAGHAV